MRTLFAIVATVLCAVSQVGCFGGHGSTSGETTTAPSGESNSEATVSEKDIADTGAAEIDITGDWLSAGAGAVWLSSPASQSIYRLDPKSGETVATVAVPQLPCAASDFGFGALWTETCDKAGLVKIDPRTNRVSRHVGLPIGALSEEGEASLGVGEGAVWLVLGAQTCESCFVAQVDPRSLDVTDRIDVREGAAAVRVGEGAVWVTNPSRSIVQKIDPHTNRVVATTQVGPTPRFLAVGEGGVWTLNQGDGSLTRLDPASGKVVATIPAQVIGEGGDITAGLGLVWVRGSGVLLTSINPKTNAIDTRYGPPSGSGAVIAASDAVWLSAHDVGKVWRLPFDPD